MKKSRSNITGFTLVEVMVVVIIIAVLAAVAIPLMSANVKRAISSEAIASLGTIRSNMRAMKAETGSYNVTPYDDDAVTDPIEDVPGFSAGDLDGQYFDDGSYKIAVTVGTGEDAAYTITATGDGSEAPGAAKAAGFIITMDQDGTIVLNEEAGGKPASE